MYVWRTYQLSDFLLFSPETYFRLFELHNQALWPWQVAAILAGFAMLAVIGQPLALLFAGAAWLLAAWLWLYESYATINWAAEWLAAGFALQGLLLWIYAFDRELRPTSGPGRSVGFMLVICALLLQPLLPWMLGRPWQQGEVFALTPGPTVVATLGLLLALRAPWLLLVLPLIWCVLDGATLWTMKAPAFWLLPLAGLLTVALRAMPLRRLPD
jgi:hypothetical protein